MNNNFISGIASMKPFNMEISLDADAPRGQVSFYKDNGTVPLNVWRVAFIGTPKKTNFYPQTWTSNFNPLLALPTN